MLIELKEKRSLTAKHFVDGEGIKLQSHVGHIHYFDKLDSNRFRGIDWLLGFDETKRGWFLSYHSFRPFFPEYSDSFAEFRDLFEGKDQTVKYKAIGERVKGILIDTDKTNPFFDDNVDNKGVLYKDVFGAGRDYILYNTRSKMVKVATVNNPNEQTEDAVFEWEIEMPGDEVYRAEKKEDAEKMKKDDKTEIVENDVIIGYKLDKTKSKTFNTGKKTLIGSSKLDGKEWYTYLEAYKAWDSEGNTINIEASIIVEKGKVILRKTIPLEFLKNAIGRVFTDTTTSYYVGAGDGATTRNLDGDDTWAKVHDPSASITLSHTATTALSLCGKRNNPVYWKVSRVFFPVDTSGLGLSDTISSASFYFYPGSTIYKDSGGNMDMRLVETTQASTSELALDDYDQCGSVDSPPLLSDDTVTYSSITGGAVSGSGSAYETMALNVIGISAINKSGYTKLGIRHGDEIQATAPSYGINIYQQSSLYTSEETGTDKDPYLEVTYSLGVVITMPAETASFALTGVAVSLPRIYSLIAETGEFALAGISNILSRIYTLIAETGEFLLTGNPITIASSSVYKKIYQLKQKSRRFVLKSKLVRRFIIKMKG